MEENKSVNASQESQKHFELNEDGWRLDIGDIEGEKSFDNPKVQERFINEAVPKLLTMLDEQMEREKKIGYKKIDRLSRQIGSVELANDYEKSSAQGVRGKIKIFLQYLLQEPKLGTAKEFLKKKLDLLKSEWENSPLSDKVSKIFFMPFSLPFAIGIGAVSAGVNSVMFIKRLSDGLKIKKMAKGQEWESEFNDAVDKYARSEELGPYSNGTTGSSALFDLAEKVDNLKGGSRNAR